MMAFFWEKNQFEEKNFPKLSQFSKKVVTLKKIGNIDLLELYHGPTLAFKDIAMQLIGNLYDHLQVAKTKAVNIIVATSGDTGSAAIAALNNRKNIKNL